MIAHFHVYRSKMSSSHVGHQAIGRCNTRGESEEYIAHRQQSMQVRDPNPGQTSSEVQNRGIMSGLNCIDLSTGQGVDTVAPLGQTSI